ncbi:MAG: 23S rRNA (adenine(2503)-C(2))-methyltransferase RlmN [Lachnospiraceae bacterium]|nr:23S rRNA (adenine(2503)-C(2))-methyltransferase RlmN [Lachnospiraceae bacterium]
MNDPIDILGLEEEALSAFLQERGEPRYRAAQLYKWLHQDLVCDYDAMTNLPRALRKTLQTEAPLCPPKPVKVQQSRLDGSKKYLFAMADGQLVEAVLMPHSYGVSACISSQAGCGMGCVFCASTLGGFIRNLSAGEMLGQVYAMQREMGEGERISRIVVMGTGEPLLNLDALLSFIRILSDEKGQNLSGRGFTVSTCGIVPGIRRLSEEGLPITLALSLHAGTQEAREALMPIAKKYPLDEVLAACRDYFSRTGRRVTFEYAVVAGVNDSRKNADELAALLGRGAHVNLIALNAVRENPLAAPDADTVARFARDLKKHGLNATIRQSMGADIDGACGQLRSHYME